MALLKLIMIDLDPICLDFVLCSVLIAQWFLSREERSGRHCYETRFVLFENKVR